MSKKNINKKLGMNPLQLCGWFSGLGAFRNVTRESAPRQRLGLERVGTIASHQSPGLSLLSPGPMHFLAAHLDIIFDIELLLTLLGEKSCLTASALIARVHTSELNFTSKSVKRKCEIFKEVKKK